MARRGFPPEVSDSLEWTFISDQSLFDGAPRDQLRQHFRTGAIEAEKSEQPRGIDGEKSWKSLRYKYCIQVDEEVLRTTTVDVDPYDNLDWGWVNIVRCWDHDFDLEGRERGREYVEVEDGDEGWMQIAAHMVGPDFYEFIHMRGSEKEIEEYKQNFRTFQDMGLCGAGILKNTAILTMPESMGSSAQNYNATLHPR